MWQVLLVIYIVLIILSAVLLWSALVVARRADHNTKTERRPSVNFTVGNKNEFKEEQAVQFPSVNDLSEK